MTPESRARAQLTQVFRAALAAVDARRAVERAVVASGDELTICGRVVAAGRRVRLLAVGKAAGEMARAFEQRAGDRIEAGLVITKEGHAAPLERSRLLFAGHPVPDSRSEAAGREAMAFVASSAPDEVTVVLLSGGASSLMACPAPGLSLDDLAQTTAVLLTAGADIEELNCVRKALSAVGGGRLGVLAASERVEVLVISDVPGDRLDLIGSGPFVANPSTRADALEVLSRRRLAAQLPVAVMAHLAASENASDRPAEVARSRVHTTLLATNADALAAAVAAAADLGMQPVVLSRSLAGEAGRVGARVAALPSALLARAGDPRPLCLVAGGETSVTVRGTGRGGRNQELALAAALVLQGRSGVDLLAVGTDGGDGPTPAAGAHVDGGTVARGRAAGREAAEALAENDSYGFFRVEGGLVTTGPTGTNVMDLLLFRIDPSAR